MSTYPLIIQCLRRQDLLSLPFILCVVPYYDLVQKCLPTSTDPISQLATRPASLSKVWSLCAFFFFSSNWKFYIWGQYHHGKSIMKNNLVNRFLLIQVLRSLYFATVVTCNSVLRLSRLFFLLVQI